MTQACGAWCAEHLLLPGLAGARCGCCAAALPTGFVGGVTCAACRRRRPSFRRVLAPFSYRQEAVRGAVLAFKHGGRRDLAAPLARSMALELRHRREAGAPASEGPGPFDLLVPVPSHVSRRLERGHDPARLLVQELELLGVGRAAPILRRTRATPPQGAPGARGRWSNVRRAFRARAQLPGGAKVWLVDDVLTSGGTAHACARALRAAGAARVDVLVFARA